MKTLILKAQTNSEWDSVDFALIELTPEFCKYIKTAYDQYRNVKDKLETGLSRLVLSMDNAEFFIDTDDEDNKAERIIMKLLGEEQHITTEQKIDRLKLLSPEQDIKYGNINVSDWGIQFVSYGKHTDEEFFTEWVNVDEFVIAKQKVKA